MSEDYYKILGINKSASEEEIKKAYRKLAHQHHPDKAEGNEAMFKKISEAYQVLSNKEKRAQYDKFGRVFEGQGQHGGGFNGFQGGGNPFGSGDFNFGFDFGGMEDLGDIFENLFDGFGGKKKRRQYERGSDLELQEEISLKDAYTGVVKKINFKTFVSCDKCSGVGHFAESGFNDCATCDGRGEIKVNQKTFFGNFAQVKACAKCRGTGKIPKKLCSSCDGTGRKIGEKNIEVNIVAGISDGQIIKVSGMGEFGAENSGVGDLYVKVKVKTDPIFKRDGDDLIMNYEANLIDLLLKRYIEIKNIVGELMKIDLPSGFKLGDKLISSGGGMPKLGGWGKGRLVINLEASLPAKLSQKSKALLEELRKEL